MYPRVVHHAGRLGGAVLGLVLLGVAALGYAPVQAASVTGSMGLTGAFSASGGLDLSDATDLDLTSGLATSADGDIGSTVAFGDPATINSSPFSIDPFAAVPNLLQIGGWTVDIGTLTIVDQTAAILTLEGSGAISGNGFDLTPTQWSLSANASGSSYSMTITAVPVPAALWLLGSGLVFISGFVRRKAA